jgi:hypothetical protein
MQHPFLIMVGSALGTQAERLTPESRSIINMSLLIIIASQTWRGIATNRDIASGYKTAAPS